MRKMVISAVLAGSVAMHSLAQTDASYEHNEAKSPLMGRSLKDYASVPKFGGYFIGKYTYSDQDGKHGGTGFSQRLVRAYVDGTILNDFKYRVQVQVSNSKFHSKI